MRPNPPTRKPDPDPARFERRHRGLRSLGPPKLAAARRRALRRQLEHPHVADGRELSRPRGDQPRLRRLARVRREPLRRRGSCSSTRRGRSSSTPATTTSPTASRPSKWRATSSGSSNIVHAKLPDTRDHLSPGEAEPRPLDSCGRRCRRRTPGERSSSPASSGSPTSTRPRRCSAATANRGPSFFSTTAST